MESRFKHFRIEDSDSDSEADVGRVHKLSSIPGVGVSVTPPVVKGSDPLLSAKAAAPPASQVESLFHKDSSVSRNNAMVPPRHVGKDSSAVVAAAQRQAPAAASGGIYVSDQKGQRQHINHEHTKGQMNRERNHNKHAPAAYNSFQKDSTFEESPPLNKDSSAIANEARIKASQASKNANKILQSVEDLEKKNKNEGHYEPKDNLKSSQFTLTGQKSTQNDYGKCAETLGVFGFSKKPQRTLSSESSTSSSHYEVKRESAAPKVERNEVKRESAAPKVERNEVKRESAAPVVERNEVKRESAAPKVERNEVKRESAAPVVERNEVKRESAAPVVERNEVKRESAAPVVERNEVKRESAAPVVERNEVKRESAAPKVERNEVKRESAAPVVERNEVKRESAAPKVERNEVKRESAAPVVERTVNKAAEGRSREDYESEKMKRFLGEKYWEKTCGFDPSRRRMPLFVAEEHCPPKRPPMKPMVSMSLVNADGVSILETVTRAPSTREVSLITPPPSKRETNVLYTTENKGSTNARVLSTKERYDEEKLKDNVNQEHEQEQREDPRQPQEQKISSEEPLTLKTVPPVNEALTCNVVTIDSLQAQLSIRSKDDGRRGLPKRSECSKSDVESFMAPSEVAVKLTAGKSLPLVDVFLGDKESLAALRSMGTPLSRIEYNDEVKEPINGTHTSLLSQEWKGENLSIKESLENAQASLRSRDRRSERLPQRGSLSGTQENAHSKDRRSDQENAHSKDQRSDRLPKRIHETKSDAGSTLMPDDLPTSRRPAKMEISANRKKLNSCHEPSRMQPSIIVPLTVRDLEKHVGERAHQKSSIANTASTSFKTCISPKSFDLSGSQKKVIADRYPSPQSKWADVPPFHRRLLNDLEEKKRRESEAMERAWKECTFQPNPSRLPVRNGRAQLYNKNSTNGVAAPRNASPGRYTASPRRAAYEEPPPTFRPTITKYAQDVHRSSTPYYERLYVRGRSVSPRTREAGDVAQSQSHHILEAIAAGNAEADAGIFPHGLYRPGISQKARAIHNDDPFYQRLYPTQKELERHRNMSRSPRQSPTRSPQRRRDQSPHHSFRGDDLNFFRPEISQRAMHIENALPFHERLYPEKDIRERQRARRDESPARSHQSPASKSPARSPQRRAIRISPRLLERRPPPVDPNPCSFRPEISPRARALSAERAAGPFHERLYPSKEEREKRKANAHQEFSFHPLITKRAQRLNLRMLENGTIARSDVGGRLTGECISPRRSEKPEQQFHSETQSGPRTENFFENFEKQSNEESSTDSVDVLE